MTFGSRFSTFDQEAIMPGKPFGRLKVETNSAFWLSFWRGVSLLAILHFVLFDLLILAAPDTIQVQYTPDDGYYYLALARNFVRFGAWTFDGGVSLTSGFHLIQAYLLAALFRFVQPSTEGFVRLGVGMSALVTLIGVLTAWKMCLRKNEPLFLIVFTILVTAKSFLFNSVSITEWPFVIFIAGFYCAYFSDERAGGGNVLIPFALGMLGSAARTDFGLLPLSILIAALYVTRRIEKSSLTREAFAGLIGAALGVGGVFIHNFVTTGAFIQSSALMKSYWSQFAARKFYSAASLGLQILGVDLGFADFERAIFLLFVLTVSGPALLILLAKISGQTALPTAFFKPDPNRSIRERVLVLASALCLGGYTFLYASSGVVQNWYTGNLTLPVLILVLAGALYLERRILREYQFATIWLSVFALIAAGVQISSLYPLGRGASPWSHQQSMLEAGKYLAQNPIGGLVGSWNSGIPGYYQGGTGVINIDGLVNNDIYPYAVGNNLPAYLRLKNIRYILDYENMFHPPFPKRGGYDDDEFFQRLMPIEEFDRGEFFEFKFLRLYRIDP